MTTISTQSLKSRLKDAESSIEAQLYMIKEYQIKLAKVQEENSKLSMTVDAQLYTLKEYRIDLAKTQKENSQLSTTIDVLVDKLSKTRVIARL